MDTKTKLASFVTEKELVDLTMELVSIPSYPGIENQETKVAKYIQSVFQEEGIPCELFEVEDGRCNIVATLKGSGGGKTIMLNGHTDTVKPDGMEKATDPFIKDGKIYGRGTSDMKGPLACMIYAMIGIKRSGISMNGDIIFAGVLDEEQNSIGTIDLIERGITADAAIVGEPTELQLCIAHRGLEWYEFKFIGKAVHGGKQKEGINAISKAVTFINALESDLIPKISERKHPLLDRATINYGVIQGGTQLSTVAGQCTLLVDRRFLPDEDYAEVNSEFKELIQKLSSEDKDFKCEMKVLDVSIMKEGYYHPPMEIEAEHPFTRLCHKVLTDVCETEIKKTLFPAWTDGSLLDKYLNIPTVVIGPGEIEACHSQTEYMPVNHLLKGYIAYAMIAVDFCNE